VMNCLNCGMKFHIHPVTTFQRLRARWSTIRAETATESFGKCDEIFCNRISLNTGNSHLSTPPGSSSIVDDKGRPSGRDHRMRGEGIPPVTRHCSRTLPPVITVCVASGYSSTAGGSRPAYKHILQDTFLTGPGNHTLCLCVVH
jgi:hypothetical protein